MTELCYFRFSFASIMFYICSRVSAGNMALQVIWHTWGIISCRVFCIIPLGKITQFTVCNIAHLTNDQLNLAIEEVLSKLITKTWHGV